MTYHTCDRCGDASLEYNRVKDAKIVNGYLFDFILCPECKKHTKPILDNGTDAFCEFIEKEKKDRMDKSSLGFKSYEFNGVKLIPSNPEHDKWISMIEYSRMIPFREFDARRMVKPPTRIQKLKRYLYHVWYALKGGECE